jgi:hypothetical protein
MVDKLNPVIHLVFERQMLIDDDDGVVVVVVRMMVVEVLFE